MTPQPWEGELGQELYKILEEYGDFFLTNYPSQAETKSIHPTARKIVKLIAQELLTTKLELLERVEKDVIGENDREVEGGVINKTIYMPYNFQVRNHLKAEQRAKLTTMKEESVQGVSKVPEGGI